MDMLVEQTHDLRYEWRNNERPLRYTDTRVDEQSRGISMKSTPMSLILEASNGKSFVMNMLDTPGTNALPWAPFGVLLSLVTCLCIPICLELSVNILCSSRTL
jgi:translation elongation factor EF-4